MVWVKGAYAAEEWSDVNIYKEGLEHTLLENEYGIGDAGHEDSTILNWLDVADFIQYHSAVKARHDMVYGKLKRFNVLTTTFRHDRRLHVLWFHAVANITQKVIILD